MPTPNALKTLVSWYKKSHRDLPWRKTSDPYKILVSEIMLQQTRVEAVIDRYLGFLRRFPTARALAEASINAVLESWEGLGYYRRARNLKLACESITYSKSGEFPKTANELLTLPGVGDYTAAAVASIAFNEAVVVLDGNVFRVMSRLFEISGKKDSGVVRADLKSKLESMFLDYEEPGISNQALMELGATVCLPVEPKCQHCPIQFTCGAYSNTTQELYPKKVPKQQSKKIKLHLLLGCNESGPLVTSKGWKAYQRGFYFPYFVESNEADNRLLNILKKSWHIPEEELRKIGTFSHLITRYKLDCTVYAHRGTSKLDYEKVSPKSTILKKAIAFL